MLGAGCDDQPIRLVSATSTNGGKSDWTAWWRRSAVESSAEVTMLIILQVIAKRPLCV